MVSFPKKLLRAGSAFFVVSSCLGQERRGSYFSRAVKGIGIGIDCVLEFAGYYDDRDYDEDYAYDFYEAETTMKIAMVGYPRTGRNSLEEALSIIGNYKSWTGTGTFENTALYRDLMNGNVSVDDFYQELAIKGYNATTRLWSDDEFEWLKRSSQVKIIMTVKDDVDKWFDSFLIYAQYYTYEFGRPYKWFESVQNVMPFYFVQQYMMTNGEPEKLWDREHMKVAYQQLINKYTSNFEEDRLFLYRVKDGWAPLCKFLDVPVPDVPFPRRNDYVVKQFELLTVKFVAWTWPIFVLLPLVVLAVAVRLVVQCITTMWTAMSSQNTTKSPHSSRYTSIDTLRGLCIVQMVIEHYLEDLSGHVVWNVADPFGATLFLLLPGISCHVSFSRQEKKRSKSDNKETSSYACCIPSGGGNVHGVVVVERVPQ